MAKTWKAEAEKFRLALASDGSSNGEKRVRTKALGIFAKWAETEGLKVGDATARAVFEARFENEALAEFRDDETGKLNRQGQAALKWGRALLERVESSGSDGQETFEEEEKTAVTAATVTAPPTPPKPRATPPRQKPPRPSPTTVDADPTPVPPESETEMPRRPPPPMPAPTAEENDDELFEEDEDEIDDVPEAVPPSQRRAAAPRPQPVIVQVDGRGRVRGHNAPRVQHSVPRGARRQSLFEKRELVRVYIRDPENGSRMLISEYSTDEIGDQTLASFIKDFVHPQHGWEDAPSHYEACAVDTHGREIQGQSARFTLQPLQDESSVQNGSDPMRTVRDAFGLVQEMQRLNQPQVQPRNELLTEAQKKAVAGGDMNQLMMLMMMERMSAPKESSNEQLILKIVDRLDAIEGKKAASANGFGGVPVPVPMPAPIVQPPPPVNHVADKLMEVSLAKMANPPTMADTLKEMLAFQQLIQGNSGSAASAELAALRGELAGIKAAVSATATQVKPGSIEEALGTVEKVSTMVKTLAPQFNNSSGIGGVVQGILSDPKVGQALGAMLGGAMGAGAQVPTAQAPTQQRVVAAAVQPPTSAQLSAGQPPQQVPQQQAQEPQAPQAVIDAVKAFQLAQTREVQVQRFLDVIFMMHLSKYPPYTSMTEPALAELNQADKDAKHLELPRKLMIQVLLNSRADLATPEFVDAVLAALIQKAGITEMPKTLLDTVGKWTVNYRGDIVMLGNVTSAAVEPAPTPASVEVAPATVTAPTTNDPDATPTGPRPLTVSERADLELKKVEAERSTSASAEAPIQLSATVNGAEKPPVALS